MRKIKCVVIDDEAIARKAIQAYIGKVDELEFVQSFRNGMEAKAWLTENAVDLLFMDINMPYLNGLELLRILKNHPPTIFTTAYPEHALESFEFNVVDYLVKPISFERFLQAVNKALRMIGSSETTEEQFLIIKEGNSIVKIKIEEIDFIEAMQNYIKIQTPQKKYTILMTMKEIASQLPENEFFQTHRSFIIQMNKIQKVEGDKVFIGNHTVPISKRSRSSFLEKFKK